VLAGLKMLGMMLCAALFALSACGRASPHTDTADTSRHDPSTATRSGRPLYRYARNPIVVYAKSDPGKDDFEYYVMARLNRRLPVNRSGRPRGDLRLNASISEFGISTFSHAYKRTCYASSYASGNDPEDAPELEHPKPGMLVTVKLYQNKSTPTVDRKVHLTRVPNTIDSTIAKYLLRLGCGV
jgi:hypothetical protein